MDDVIMFKRRRYRPCFFTTRYPHRTAYSHSWTGVYLAWRGPNPMPVRIAQQEAWIACFPDAN